MIEWHPNSIGGVQTHVRDLAYQLLKKGFKVSIVSRKIGVEGSKFQEVKGHYLINPAIPLDIIMVPPDTSHLKTTLNSVKPDVVHSHHIFTLTPLIALKTANDLGIPRLATNHTTFLAHDFRSFWNAMSIVLPTKYYLRYAQAIISVSKTAETFMESIIGYDLPIKKYLIPNGVDIMKFTPPKDEPEDDVIVFIGRLVYRKGLHVLLDAFSRVLKERDAILYVVGKGYMEETARLLVKAYRMEGKVKFLGVIPESEKPDIYRKAKVVVIPSLFNESFCIVALEAMASGRAVIASRVGGIKEVIKHGESGILVNPGSSEELANAIKVVLDDKNLRLKLGGNARNVVEHNYSWDIIIEKIVKVYEDILI
ncbi:MAG: glycosyltransferase family 4 protein [Sulfolobales archaeon]